MADFATCPVVSRVFRSGLGSARVRSWIHGFTGRMPETRDRGWPCTNRRCPLGILRAGPGPASRTEWQVFMAALPVVRHVRRKSRPGRPWCQKGLETFPGHAGRIGDRRNPGIFVAHFAKRDHHGVKDAEPGVMTEGSPFSAVSRSSHRVGPALETMIRVISMCSIYPRV